MYHFSRTLCSLSVPGIQEGAELHAVLRSEIVGKSTCLDSLQWLFSVTFYLKDYPFCCNWWNFILNGWVIILLKIYKHAFLQIKYACFIRDLGPLQFFCLWQILWSVEAYWALFLARVFKTSLKWRPVPSWAVQVLCMGFIGFPRNLRDIALSLFLSFRRLQSPGPSL